MRSFLAASLAVLTLISRTLAAGSCDCYETSAGDFFTTHQFLDFRNGKPSNFDDVFTILEVDSFKGTTVNNKMTSANIAFNNGQMSLLTKNDGSGTQQSADMYSKPSMLYGSFRIHAQITGAAGAVAGFFTYLDVNNEQDMEILTNEAPTQIHYTNHDNGGAGTGNPTLNTTIGSPWTNYNTYRLDWIPTKTSFAANDDPVKELTVAVPSKACTLNVNMWSSGEGWGGAMASGESATLNVQWIEAVYNASAAAPSRVKRYASNGVAHHDRRQAGSCTNVCKVDGVATLGTPEPVGAGGVGVASSSSSSSSSMASPSLPSLSSVLASPTSSVAPLVPPTSSLPYPVSSTLGAGAAYGATSATGIPSASGIHGAPPSLDDGQDECDTE